MSKITNVIIAASLDGSQKMVKAQLDAYTSKLNAAPFLYLDKCSVGGDHCLRADVFVAAFDNLDLGEFVRFFQSLHFARQDGGQSLQVFIKHDLAACFSLFTQATIEQFLTNPAS